MEDSDDDSDVGLGHGVSGGAGGGGGGDSKETGLKLPTRWSERIRHQSLSVSPDGRELTFNGLHDHLL